MGTHCHIYCRNAHDALPVKFEQNFYNLFANDPPIESPDKFVFGDINYVLCGSAACKHLCPMIDNPEKYSVHGDQGELGPPGQIDDS